jgi:uncharacterized RDD family membrane protein YckC
MTHFHHINRWDLNVTRGGLSLVVLCFLLPFFTFTLSSCGGTDASQTLKVTGIQLIRHKHGPVENHTTHAPPVGRQDEVPRAADSGQGTAIAVVVLAVVALVATLMPRRIRGLPTVAATTGVVWTFCLLAGAVSVPGVDVGYEPGFVLGLILAIASAAAAAVIPFKDRPLGADPDQARRGGFGIRLGSWMLDVLVLVALAWPAVFLIGNATGHAVSSVVTITVVVVAYRVATERSPLRGTIGQWMAGLEVTTTDGRAVSVPRSALRAICDLTCLVFLFGLGHLVASMTPGNRALHDVLSGTQVVRRAPQPAAADPPLQAATAGS